MFAQQGVKNHNQNNRNNNKKNKWKKIITKKINCRNINTTNPFSFFFLLFFQENLFCCSCRFIKRRRTKMSEYCGDFLDFESSLFYAPRSVLNLISLQLE